MRDPLSLFVSAFHSRLRKGQPKFYFEWSPAEAAAFERFSTPQSLAEGLGSADRETRQAALAAMKAIQHIRGIRRFLGSPKQVMSHRRQIAYIGRQETLDDDWQRIRALLELPEEIELPSDPKKAHRRAPSGEPALDARAEEILRDYYRPDYEIIAACERLRVANGWSGEPPNRQARAQDRARRLSRAALAAAGRVSPAASPRGSPARCAPARRRRGRGSSRSAGGGGRGRRAARPW